MTVARRSERQKGEGGNFNSSNVKGRIIVKGEFGRTWDVAHFMRVRYVLIVSV